MRKFAAAGTAARLVAVVLLVATLANARAQSNLPVPKAEPEFVEQGVPLPAYPGEASLVRFPTEGNNTVFIDTQTLAIGKDGVVRYALVVRSPSGADNVSFEGIRCATDELRVYAYGRKTPEGGAWSLVKAEKWMHLRGGGLYSRYRLELWRDVFCYGEVPETPRTMLENLRRGGRAQR